MSSKGRILCIQEDSIASEQRKLLLEGGGYQVSVAADEEGLAILGSFRVDAVVFEYPQQLAIAKKVREINSKVPLIMVADTLDFPDSAVESIDALVANHDGTQFLLDTLNFLLKVKPGQLTHSAHNDTQKVRNTLAKSTASAWRASVAE